jgi:tetrahydromethanopterin S-methyltransferase subunit G
MKQHDNLAPAVGILWGLVVSITLWALAVLVYWILA